MGSLPQDVYATNLQQNLGYPLRSPEPSNTLRELYEEGLRIGDVGYVNAYGEFVDFFNICFPPPAELCDAGLPPYDPIRVQMPYTKPAALAADYLFMNGVERNLELDESRLAYKFTAKSNAGAILILPSGATLSEIQHKSDLEAFRKVAAKHALTWCQFAEQDSLYLVTGVYKTRSWTLGSFYKGFIGGEIHVERITGRQAYKWKPAFEADWQAGPQSSNYENHTILIKGFKMTIRWKKLPVIEWVARSESRSARKIVSSVVALLVVLKALFAKSRKSLSRTTIEHSPRLSQPLHPLDVINRYLLEKNTGARVAITHDNEWIDMLEKKRLSPGELMEETRLRAFLEQEYTWYCEDGTIYLQSQTEDINGIHHKSEILPPLSVTESLKIVITHIRAENVTAGLGRIPVGFYVQLDFHDGTFRRTKIKSVAVCDPVIQWDDVMQLPSNPSIMVSLTVYACFELVPMLGKGEPLHELTISVGDLLSQSGRVITVSIGERELLPVCCSLLITVHQWHNNRLPRASTQVDGSMDWEHSSELAMITDLGHDALRRYRRNHCKPDLEASVAYFERALDICGGGHPCRAAALFNLATAMFATHQADGSSLNLATSRYREALELRHDGHPDRAATLLHLSQAVLHDYGAAGHELSSEGELQKIINELIEVCPQGYHERRAAGLVLQTYERIKLRDFVDSVELNKLVSMLEDAAQEPPEGYFDKPNRFNNLGLALLRRSQLHRDPLDLDRAIEWLEETTRITPNSHLDKLSYLKDLGTALLNRFKRLKVIGDLDAAIKSVDLAAALTPDGYRTKPTYVNNLGTFLLIRFEYLGELSDLEQAVAWFTEGIHLMSDGHPDKPGCLNNIGHSSLARFRRLGESSDLERAITMFGDAAELTPSGHPDKPSHLNNLGHSFLIRFERLGEPSDLEQAVSMCRNAVNLTFDGHSEKPSRLNNFGNALLARFKRLGETGDLQQAIAKFGDAVDLAADGHPDKPDYLDNLGHSFLTRFKRLGELNDLEQAVSRCRDSVGLTPDGHPNKPRHLNSLGNSFLASFERLGALSDLEEAIWKFGEAANLTPDGHADKPSCLNNLGTSFHSRFRRLGEPSDLEQAIARFEDAINLLPDDHPDKPGCLNNLGNSFLTRFEHFGRLSDLERAISTLVSAVNLIPGGHPDKPGCLNNLGNSFLTRFERLGELSDLEQAISRLGDAIDLTPDGHPDKPGCLGNLGSFFLNRFKRLGELNDLEQAVSRCRDAVDLTPDSHSDKPRHFNNLGNSFLTRFSHLGELSDLEQAIWKFEDAAALTPDGHPDKPSRLNNLGTSFHSRFRHLGELSDLERAIVMFGDAAVLTPDGHPDKPSFLNDLGNSFLTRFERLGELSDLERTVSMCRAAVDLTPDDHPDKPGHLSSLGTSFHTRFEHLGVLSDLEQATARFGNAADLTPEGHPDKPACLNNFARSVKARFDQLHELSALEQTISLYSHAASACTGPATTRFHASLQWISCARASGHHSLLHAYSSAIGLLPQLGWIGLSLAHRYRELMRGADVVREAAAAALDSGLPETAVEWLEQGRSIVWGELFQLRSSHEELSSVHPDHSRRLQQLSTALEHASATREKSLSSLMEQTQNAEHHAIESLEQEARRHRMLAIERDKLLQEIRRLPGFEKFLLRKGFYQLRASAHSGPVVILNAAETRCDALIVLADVENAIHVPLRNLSLERITMLQGAMKSLHHRHGGVTCFYKRAGGVIRKPDQNSQWQTILATLWEHVVKPVLDSLALCSLAGSPSRIFWCPTGPFAFLPIHAAGFYDTSHSQVGHKVSDFVVSSYAPTLNILAPSSEFNAPHGNIRILFVRQPPSDGQVRLPGVDVEFQYIKAVLQESSLIPTTLLESSAGTVEEVLTLMKEADWAHFACHGIQDPTNPTDSGLCLANERRLKLSDIVTLSRPCGGLAFLSACQTATGDKNLSDEAIHIAAGMLFAGYRGVIGTMWSISDRIAPTVAKDVYEQLFRSGMTPDHQEAARALQDAVGRLRDSGASFGDWLPFIHVGV